MKYRERQEVWTCASCSRQHTVRADANGNLATPARWHCLAIAPGDPSYDASWKRYLICPECTEALTNGVTLTLLRKQQP